METALTYSSNSLKEMTATQRGDLRRVIRRVDSIIITGQEELSDRRKKSIVADLRNSHLPNVKYKSDYNCMVGMIDRLEERLGGYRMAIKELIKDSTK